MIYPLHARTVLAIGLAVFALSGAAAKADVIYTVTTTGTISSGTSDGTFGVNGANLAGKTFTATETFDATLSTLNSGSTASDYLSPATASASITVGNNTYNIASNMNSSSLYDLASIIGGYSLDAVYSVVHSATPTASFYENFQESAVAFLSSDSLSQTAYYAVSGSGINYNAVSFNAPDGTMFNATVSTISLNAAAPEPRSIALFGAGLVGLASLRRRRAA